MSDQTNQTHYNTPQQVEGAASGDAAILLFLDFDGTTHPTDVLFDLDYSADPLAVPDGCFVHVPALAAALEPFPEVRIVISSSWRHFYDFPSLKTFLGPLGARITETTGRRVGTRFEDIAGLVTRRRPGAWLALDDDGRDFPDDIAKQHLIETDPRVGLTPQDLAEMQRRLAGFRAATKG